MSARSDVLFKTDGGLVDLHIAPRMLCIVVTRSSPPQVVVRAKRSTNGGLRLGYLNYNSLHYLSTKRRPYVGNSTSVT
ncbi:hypothetical protein R1flu_008000 [Riccia fluitans]|uniref:Uncharacterized protein n=1 Tax=Riccia fluitans TaxID=41844 RepID=A0ABD1YAM3_9MARC